MSQRQGAPDPEVVVEGLEEILKRDLAKHQVLLARSRAERLSYASARSHEVEKKKHYIGLLKGKIDDGRKYNPKSMRTAIEQININIKHMSDKVKLADDSIAHHGEIVDTLTVQLAAQMVSLDKLAKWRETHGTVH